jgi:hypothetical protein
MQDAQKESDLNEYFKKNYSRLDLEYFIFYEAELVSCMLDTGHCCATRRLDFHFDLDKLIIG